ncbi:hypothetical protein DVK00_02765 [Haloarcula sp. Atlit-47R]|uniref:hypothetical protein n=1 Tax=Haloarcula sp. Atlit-47R TaxID=2282132 RepID=UPI000EF2393C|nr:hypothetical protein [Haloarcula sp. Atlit-47R]RLM47446.1 hypothetical protein DVK00_02765 [Haloarcula sp. Atlit-47R]
MTDSIRAVLEAAQPGDVLHFEIDGLPDKELVVTDVTVKEKGYTVSFDDSVINTLSTVWMASFDAQPTEITREIKLQNGGAERFTITDITPQ